MASGKWWQEQCGNWFRENCLNRRNDLIPISRQPCRARHRYREWLSLTISQDGRCLVGLIARVHGRCRESMANNLLKSIPGAISDSRRKMKAAFCLKRWSATKSYATSKGHFALAALSELCHPQPVNRVNKVLRGAKCANGTRLGNWISNKAKQKLIGPC